MCIHISRCGGGHIKQTGGVDRAFDSTFANQLKAKGAPINADVDGQVKQLQPPRFMLQHICERQIRDRCVNAFHPRIK